MTSVTLADVILLARALWESTPQDRDGLAREIVSEARVAETYRRSTGGAHPVWGDGSLSSAVLMRSAPRAPLMMSAGFADCLKLAIDASCVLYDAAQAEQRRAVGASLRRSTGGTSPRSSQVL